MFFNGVGISVLLLIILIGIFSWLLIVYRWLNKKYKYPVKYKLFKKKFPIKVTESLQEHLDQNTSDLELRKSLLLGGFTPNQAQEIIYIYNEMKGGIKK